MRWPFVSAKYAAFLEQTVERLTRERDEQQRRGDAAMDQLTSRFGFESLSPLPATAGGAARTATSTTAQDEIAKYLSDQFEDPHAGMISEEIVRLAEAETKTN